MKRIVRRTLKFFAWLIGIPVFLFVLAMCLLYVSPVQNFIRAKATAYASALLDMDISVRRIDLHFPLNLRVSDVVVVQATDTIFNLASLDVQVQAKPLFRGQVEVDKVEIMGIDMNTANLLEGMCLKGSLGRFALESHGVDLVNETAVINEVALSDTDVFLELNDTTETVEEDTTTTNLKWKVKLNRLLLDKVSFAMHLPADTMQFEVGITKAEALQALADLGNNAYGLEHFDLEDSKVSYTQGTAPVVPGFDASHLLLRDVTIGLDSLYYGGKDVQAVIRACSMYDRSGLDIVSLTGRLKADSSRIMLPALQLRTPHSAIDLRAHTQWEMVDNPSKGKLLAKLKARLGKQDLFLFAGNLPEQFKMAYPAHPLVVQAETGGNFTELQLSHLIAELPGAFKLDGKGVAFEVMDSLKRQAKVQLDLQTKELNFLRTLVPGMDTLITIPDTMSMQSALQLNGSALTAQLTLQEQTSAVQLNGSVDLTSEDFAAKLALNDVRVDHFMPRDSIYGITLKADVNGKGLDFANFKTFAQAKLDIEQFQFGKLDFNAIQAEASLAGALATAKLTSKSDLLGMTMEASYNMAKSYTDAVAKMNVDYVDLYTLGIWPEPLKRPVMIQLEAQAKHNEVKALLAAGDFSVDLKADDALEPVLDDVFRFSDVLTKQLKHKQLDHAALRKSLPVAQLTVKSGTENPVSWYLQTQKMKYEKVQMNFSTSPERGFNGRAFVKTFKMDTLQLDTLALTMLQDTSKLRIYSGVINDANNPHISFRTTLIGEIRDKDAELNLKYMDAAGDTGLLFGINARPFSEGKSDGLVFTMVPDEPIIAFRKFRFKDKHNWFYLHNNLRAYANVDLRNEEGMGIRVQSIESDTVSLQNMDVGFSRIPLGELLGIIPYIPKMDGLLSADLHYIQLEEQLQLSTEINAESFSFEEVPVGNLAMGATWLPGSKGEQYVDTYLARNNEDLLFASGSLLPTENNENKVNLDAELIKLPLDLANGFVPDEMIALKGALNAALQVSGTLDKPVLNGEVRFDTTSVYARQADARFTFDNRPVRLENNLLKFDKFAIYTTSKNPFTIDGSMNFTDLTNPMANLSLKAKNYTLLDAKRSRESLVYGKIFVDFNASVKGKLDALVMRGNMNLLDNTNVAYVLTDSPLSVQDRLNEMVSFTSFTDTISVNQTDLQAISLGGLDMSMGVQIAPSVRFQVDLNADRSNRIEVVGEGNLAMKYTPQGVLSLTGRYTLTGGLMSYSFPLIPTKEFKIANGSYVDFTGDVADPTINFKAVDRVRAMVGKDGNSRPVNFDVSVIAKNKLENLDFGFNIEAPEDAEIQNQLLTMGPDERTKQAIFMLASGMYMAESSGGSGLDMGSALNNVLSSQINSLASNLKGASLSVGLEDRDNAEGNKQTDFSFRYSQRFFNDRFQIVLGGKVSTGENVSNDIESFIDNISLEYRLDASGTRYVRLFYDKNYESIMEGEITETGLGVVLRKKMNKLSELFIFRNKNEESKRKRRSRAKKEALEVEKVRNEVKE